VTNGHDLYPLTFVSSPQGIKVLGIAPESPMVSKLEQMLEFHHEPRIRLTRHTHNCCLGEALKCPLPWWDCSFSALAVTMIEQQNSWRSATRSVQSLYLRSERVTDGLRAFPSPQQILGQPELLDDLAITHRRKNYLRAVAGAMTEDPNLLDSLCDDLERAEGRLCEIKGIGPWTARVFLSKRFGYRKHIPVNDVALQRAAHYFLRGSPGKIGAKELPEAFSIFGDLAGEAAHRLLLRWVLEQYETL